MLEHFKTTINNASKNNQRLVFGQRHNPFMNQANFGCLGDRKFLVSASWWSKWCDYVNYTVDEHGFTFPRESFRDELLCDTNEENDLDVDDNPFRGVEAIDIELEEQQNKVDRILRLSIYQQSSFATLAEAIENENEQSQLFYERPGCIENKNLLEPEVTYLNQVKKTAVEHFDFEVVPHQVWQHLYSWYSADVTICRKLAIDMMNNKGDTIGSTQGNPFVSVHGNDSLSPSDSYRQQPYRVFFDLFPTQQPVYNTSQTRQTQFLDRRTHDKFYSDIDEVENSNSNETTYLLYKQQIEDHSQTQSYQPSLTGTPENAYYRLSDKKKEERKQESNHEREQIFTGGLQKSH